MDTIRLVYFSEAVPDQLIDELVGTIAMPGLSPIVERVEKFPIQAGIEWLAPTALVVYIAKPYFEAFLSELGKDHYALLKKALKTAANRLLGRSGPKIRIVHSGGKSRGANKYSMAFSICVVVDEKLNLKLLFPLELTTEEVHEAIEAYTDFIENLYLGNINQDIIEKLKGGRVVGRTMLIAYDFEKKILEPIDPILKNFR